MYNQVREDILYIMLYATVIALAMVASCYLLFRDGNAFASDITPPKRLRRWAAAFFASLALNHLWYMPMFYLDSSRDIKTVDLVGGLLDSITFLPLAINVLLIMLQDRRRPLWPAFIITAPLAAGSVWCIVSGSYTPPPVFYGFALLLGMGITIYIIRALRQYERWLHDNYADLEHKEVWQSFTVLGITLMVFVVYALVGNGPVYQYAMQMICIIVVGHLLWRVETLSDLSDLSDQKTSGSEADPLFDSEVASPDTSKPQNLNMMLQQHCIDTQLYLQHDLTIVQLAKALGTNRFYLSQYFSSQGINYNAYINNLRIRHFMQLYRQAVANQRPFTAQQLAHESGYRSYSTFGIAFKQRMGQTVTAWMRDNAKQ